MTITFVGDYLPVPAVDPSPLVRPGPTVGNLECAIATERVGREKAYSVVLGPEAFDTVAASGFAALSLANNHVADAGGAALQHMIERLGRIPGIQFYGTRRHPFAVLEADRIRCAVVGALERCRARCGALFREEDVEALVRRLAREYDRVVVTPHWGKEGEYASHPSPRQRRLAAKWVAAGADAVFGHHSHTIQGTERIGSAPVCYSLGNFFFPHQEGRRHPLTRYGLLARYAPASGSVEQVLTVQATDGVRALEDDLAERLWEYVQEISADLAQAWSKHRWARAVGPVYISKSARSWRRRLQLGSAFRVLPKWAAWSVLPTTLLMRLGNLLPDRAVLRRRSSLEDLLRARACAPAFGATDRSEAVT